MESAVLFCYKGNVLCYLVLPRWLNGISCRHQFSVGSCRSCVVMVDERELDESHACGSGRWVGRDVLEERKEEERSTDLVGSWGPFSLAYLTPRNLAYLTLIALYVFLRFSRFRHFSRAVVIRQIWGRKRREEKRRKASWAHLHQSIIECEESSQEVIIISVQLARNVKAYGGKFLEKGKDNLWYEMDENAARKKASQVLREEKWD